MKRIGVITYDYPHSKTEQVLHAFVRMGYSIEVYALPFLPRKGRDVLFEHRPDQSGGVRAEAICKKFGLRFFKCDTDAEIRSGCDYYHVLIGKLISSDCLADKRIINCHPGIIPAVRGLDAFKWAVLNNRPLGNTLHYIDEAVDMGEVISIEPTPVYKTDNLERMAQRHYEYEIDMVVNFERYLEQPSNAFADVSEGAQNMRMNRATEQSMLDVADRYIREQSERSYAN